MDDISTEELSDISQDNTDSQKDLLSPSKREGELLAQIADIEEKLELLGAARICEKFNSTYTPWVQ